MFKLSKKVDYGLILLGKLYSEAHGAMPQGDRSSARELAGRHDLPQPMVANVLKELTTAGILASTRGAQGGYTLARDAGHISLWDVVQALDGPFGLMECTGEAPTCERQGGCPMHQPIQRVHRRFQDFMAGYTLEEIMQGATLPVFKPEGGANLLGPPQG